ncbi:MAG TPA: lipopolysaccharide heptosyltransferase II [Pyrinomonadaceae bacterium]|nr:lipopolysaccharide heptosyltransferase II [Pyrinomonadaceae bacterium]
MSERTLQAERIERVIVRGVNWVGDAVMTIPALRELRRVLPGAHITLATRAWAEGIFADADFIDELLPLDWQLGGVPAFLQQVRAWRNGAFDLALLLPNAFAPAFIAAAARVPLRIGYATDARRLLLTHPLAVPAWRGQRHEVFYYLNLVGELERLLTGASQVDDGRAPRLDLQVSFERREHAREILARLGVEFDADNETLSRPLVALCPGSTNSRAKRWPAERFAVLADRLMDEAGADCLLVGASEELDVTEEVSALMRHTPLVLTGRTSLAETVAVLSLVNLLVSNDTGPAHVAAALARPVLVIFGPTDPVTTRPFSDTAQVVRQPPECAPCMLRDCPIDHRCMTAISPDELFTRAAQILDEHTTRHQQRTRAEDQRDRAKDAREGAQDVRDDALDMRESTEDVREGALDESEGALFEHTGAEVEG